MKNIYDMFADYSGNVSDEILVYTLEKQDIPNFKKLMERKIPFCYILKEEIKNLKINGKSFEDIMNDRLPDIPRIMSGDFGELVSLFYLSGKMLKEGNKKENIHPVMKWHFKEARNRPGTHSDVIIICRDNLNTPSENDMVICAEAKSKATNGKTDPIGASIEGAEKDKISRLAQTLVWLKEKTATDARYIHFEDCIKRFAHNENDEIMPYEKKYIAISIIAENLLQQELQKPRNMIEGIKVIVLGIEDTKDMYEEIFERAKARR